MKHPKTCDGCAAFRTFVCELGYANESTSGFLGIVVRTPPKTGCPKPLTTAEFIEVKKL